MTKKRYPTYAQRMAAIRKQRRKNWNEHCTYCGLDWHNAKTNVYLERSQACCQCMTNVAAWCKRGAAAITRRIHQLSKWDRRMKLGAGGQVVRKLKVVAGGRQ